MQHSENKNRIAVLNNRYEKLIELNQRHRYTSGEKCEKYLNLLTAIKAEKTGIYLFNRENNENYKKHLETARKNALNVLTPFQLYNLTAPI